jgi:3-methyladenine DNA glycosylase AlkD
VKLTRRAADEIHDEVVAALRKIGNPDYGAGVAKDRGSSLEHLGIGFPELRKRVKKGFSFYDRSEDEVLAIWDRLWRTSPYGDVLFAALEYYLPRVRKRVSPALWPVVRLWPARVDNWCHSDGLSSIYSWILASHPGEVYPQLETWNREPDLWLRRISIVSLIHYSGKNAVFMPLDRVLPLITACLDDEREYVQKAAGWVLREMGNAYPDEARGYLEEHIEAISSIALRRAVERRSPEEKAALLELRRRARRR